MDGKVARKKSFWKFSKSKNTCVLKKPEVVSTNGNLRSLFMDDTALSFNQRQGSLVDAQNFNSRCQRHSRERRSLCIPEDVQQSFLHEMKFVGLDAQSEGKNKVLLANLKVIY